MDCCYGVWTRGCASWCRHHSKSASSSNATTGWGTSASKGAFKSSRTASTGTGRGRCATYWPTTSVAATRVSGQTYYTTSQGWRQLQSMESALATAGPWTCTRQGQSRVAMTRCLTSCACSRTWWWRSQSTRTSTRWECATSSSNPSSVHMDARAVYDVTTRPYLSRRSRRRSTRSSRSG